jgi:hypothetical protein
LSSNSRECAVGKWGSLGEGFALHAKGPANATTCLLGPNKGEIYCYPKILDVLLRRTQDPHTLFCALPLYRGVAWFALSIVTVPCEGLCVQPLAAQFCSLESSITVLGPAQLLEGSASGDALYVLAHDACKKYLGQRK